MEKYDIWIWSNDHRNKVYIGRYTETFAMEYCKQFAGLYHIKAEKVKNNEEDHSGLD